MNTLHLALSLILVWKEGGEGNVIIFEGRGSQDTCSVTSEVSVLEFCSCCHPDDCSDGVSGGVLAPFFVSGVVTFG